MVTYIIGHFKPDLDSVVSTISLQHLFYNANCFQRKEAKPVLAGEANHETKAIFNKFRTQIPKVLKNDQIDLKDLFVLVDHNEPSQRLPGIKNKQITDIFDHHKVVVNFSMPIFITTKPWGSTNTIIYWLMKMYNIKPDKNLASLMISAILSDTVGLKSPTTTETDKLFLEELNKIAQIEDINALTLEIFKAKSKIGNLTPEQIVKNDYKIYNFSGKKVFINQVETVEQEKVLAKKPELLKAMETVKQAEKVDYIFVVISDVLKINSKMLYLTNGKVVSEKAFKSRGEENVLDIGPKLSRKKEIAPRIEKALE